MAKVELSLRQYGPLILDLHLGPADGVGYDLGSLLGLLADHYLFLEARLLGSAPPWRPRVSVVLTPQVSVPDASLLPGL
jgi:hypothetical protein